MKHTRLSTELKQLATMYPLDDFDWELPANCPILIPSSEDSGYAKHVYLKENFHSTIGNDTSLKSHYWAIQDWGKIGSFKKHDRNDRRIRVFLDEVKTGKLTKKSFGCISSLSKVASFVEPSTYAIYDSRAIYSLNWLLFNYTTDRELFPQPIGRSTDLLKLDMQTIFRLTKIPHFYRSHKTAFHEYCRLMQSLATEIFGPGSKPYKAEMLLFVIAPSWVVKSVEESVLVSINTAASPSVERTCPRRAESRLSS